MKLPLQKARLLMMDNGIEMQTIFGDGSQQQDNSLLVNYSVPVNACLLAKVYL